MVSLCWDSVPNLRPGSIFLLIRDNESCIWRAAFSCVLNSLRNGFLPTMSRNVQPVGNVNLIPISHYRAVFHCSSFFRRVFCLLKCGQPKVKFPISFVNVHWAVNNHVLTAYEKNRLTFIYVLSVQRWWLCRLRKQFGYYLFRNFKSIYIGACTSPFTRKLGVILLAH